MEENAVDYAIEDDPRPVDEDERDAVDAVLRQAFAMLKADGILAVRVIELR